MKQLYDMVCHHLLTPYGAFYVEIFSIIAAAVLAAILRGTRFYRR